jgi:hypothetical protein
MTTNILNCIENYNKSLEYDVCTIFIKYIGLIHELIDSITEKLYLQNHKYLKHVIQKGIINTTRIYTYLLLYTKNLELSVYHTQKSILYYIEFIDQIGEDNHNLLNLNSNDATLFIYKKTIFDINSEYRKEYIESTEIKNTMNLIHNYMDIYNNIIIHYINEFNFNCNDLIDLRKIIFTKLYSIVELLIQTPHICKKHNITDKDELLKLNTIVCELNMNYKYSFIENNYMSLIEYIIKKNNKTPINIYMFCNKFHNLESCSDLNNSSLNKICNFLLSK